MVDMLTEVDGEEIGLWLTLAEIARRRGVSRAAISKRVKRLEAEGSIKTRPGAGSTIKVELAAFDLATNETTPLDDERPARKTHSQRSPKPQGPAADKVRYEAALRRLDYEERVKNLLPTKLVEDAMCRAGETIVRVLGQISTYAPDLMAAAKEGEPALRRQLRKIEHELRAKIGAALTLLADEGRTDEATGGVEFDLDEIEGREESHG